MFQNSFFKTIIFVSVYKTSLFTPEAPAPPMFIAALFTIAKLWKQP
jgi:hypothetical protein